MLTRTKDLETSGGSLYLVHENEQVVIDECQLLHKIEMNYPALIFQDMSSYEQGLLDLSNPQTFCDLEIVFRQIYEFAAKIREGGRLIIPESTYCNIPYGMEGMEILLKIAGLQIECPLADMGNLLHSMYRHCQWLAHCTLLKRQFLLNMY